MVLHIAKYSWPLDFIPLVFVSNGMNIGVVTVIVSNVCSAPSIFSETEENTFLTRPELLFI